MAANWSITSRFDGNVASSRIRSRHPDVYGQEAQRSLNKSAISKLFAISVNFCLPHSVVDLATSGSVARRKDRPCYGRLLSPSAYFDHLFSTPQPHTSLGRMFLLGECGRQ